MGGESTTPCMDLIGVEVPERLKPITAVVESWASHLLALTCRNPVMLRELLVRAAVANPPEDIAEAIRLAIGSGWRTFSTLGKLHTPLAPPGGEAPKKKRQLVEYVPKVERERRAREAQAGGAV